MHPTEPSSPTSARFALPEGELLSALADGELSGGNVAAACGAYAATPESSARWHAYHLIGDVLRSEDLACRPERDLSFLASLRAELAKEPVMLAPQIPVPSAGRAPVLPDSRRSRATEGAGRGLLARWGIVPSAMAAGFALVAAGLVGVRLLAPTAAPDAVQARAAVPTTPSPAADVERVAAVPAPAALPAEPQVMVANSSVVRNARLDRYLAAHQQFAGTSALAVPSTYLRNVAVDAPR